MSDEHSSATAGLNLLGALLVHFFVGVPVLFGVVGILSFSNGGAGAIWGLCAVGLWIAGLVRSARRRADFGAVWSIVLGSWLLAILGPIGVAYAVYAWRVTPEEPVNPEVERRLNLFAQRLAELQRELVEIRRLAEGEAVSPTAPPAPAARPAPAPPPRPAPKLQPQPQRAPSYWDREIDYGALLGAKGLAWAGGIVTVLGVVFFFVLAVNRGWIGPVERVGLGALASSAGSGCIGASARPTRPTARWAQDWPAGTRRSSRRLLSTAWSPTSKRSRSRLRSRRSASPRRS